MRILLKLVLDCDTDAAWRALHSPAVIAELYGPLLELQMLSPASTTRLEPGDDLAVQLRVGPVPLGRQLISVSERTADAGRTRILRDSGIPLTGPLSVLDVWDHQLAVTPAPGDAAKTLWRERLVIRGVAAPALWPVLWAVWQARGIRLRTLAPQWAHDPAEEAAGDEPAD